jgi:membrane protein implicated in regulation of membrane protease activity
VRRLGNASGMTSGGSILLIAVGAILRYAVTASVSGISIQTIGLILMIAGIAALVLSLLYTLAWGPRRRVVTRETGAVTRDPDLY